MKINKGLVKTNYPFKINKTIPLTRTDQKLPTQERAVDLLLFPIQTNSESSSSEKIIYSEGVRVYCKLPQGKKGEVLFRPKREKFIMTLVLTSLSKRGDKGLLTGSQVRCSLI